MDKWFCVVTGENYIDFTGYHNDTKRRVRSLGVLIHIPVIVWALIGFLVSFEIFKASILWSLISAMLMSIVIFAFEYAIIQIKNVKFKDNWNQILGIGTPRIVLALLMAIVGSFVIDTKLFEQDISAQLSTDTQHAIEIASISKAKKLQNLNSEENNLVHRVEKISSDISKESGGIGGSRQKGNGPNVKRLEQSYKIESITLNQFREIKPGKIAEINRFYDQEVNRIIEKSNSPGLLTRISALHDFVLTNRMALYLFSAIFIVFVILEMLVLLVKIFSGTTSDDKKDRIKAKMEIEEAKTRQNIRSINLNVFKNTYDPRLEKAKSILRGVA